MRALFLVAGLASACSVEAVLLQIGAATDTDVDTDPDTDPDTGPVTRDGEYVGALDLTITIPAWDSTQACTGPGQITVVMDADPQVILLGSCVMGGVELQFGVEGTGNVVPEPNAAGSLRLWSDFRETQTSWQGGFIDDHTFLLWFDGELSGGGGPRMVIQGELEGYR